MPSRDCEGPLLSRVSFEDQLMLTLLIYFCLGGEGARSVGILIHIIKHISTAIPALHQQDNRASIHNLSLNRVKILNSVSSESSDQQQFKEHDQQQQCRQSQSQSYVHRSTLKSSAADDATTTALRPGLAKSVSTPMFHIGAGYGYSESIARRHADLPPIPTPVSFANHDGDAGEEG